MAKHLFTCIDAHTCGNPVRLVVGGAPDLMGKDMQEKRLHFIEHYDWIRTGLMFEPRGHDGMSGGILYPPCDTQNDMGIVFIETGGCLPMCGHGTIGITTIALEEGLVNPQKEGILRVETPAGLIIANYKKEGEKVQWVRITNVLSFLVGEGYQVECTLGMLSVDVAYGGNFYAIVDAQPHFKDMAHFSAQELITLGKKVRTSINTRYGNEFVHPNDAHISGVSHVMWTGKPTRQNATTRNAVCYGDKAIDRSPCGTGTSARMAQWFAKGKLNVGDTFIHESIIGSTFLGRIEATTFLGKKEAIIPSIQGWAQVFGRNTIIIDKDDPYAFGFQVL